MIDLERTDYEFRRKIKKKQQYKKKSGSSTVDSFDLSMDGYMKIQRRLMEEQIRLWSNCGLGQSILKESIRRIWMNFGKWCH